MTKTTQFLSMAFLVLAGAMIMGCTREQQPEDPSGNVVIRTATISLDGSEPTRALSEGGVKTLAADEQIAVVYEKDNGSYAKVVATLAPGDIAEGGKSATITVPLTDPKTDGVVKYIYPVSCRYGPG